VIEEVLVMRKFLLLLPLVLAGCGSDGNGGTADWQTVEHPPELADLSLSPDTAMYMAGDGSVSIAADFAFADAGLDIESMYVEMSDGTSFVVDFAEAIDTETGTRSEVFDVSTAVTGTNTIEIWLQDGKGATSNHMTARFNVVAIADGSDWTARLTGLPFVLNDVVWDGEFFVAVGDSGTILTSADGIDWVERDSGTDANLHAAASAGSELVVAGSGATVLLSTDHGASWTTKHSGSRVYLPAVAITDAKIVAGGMDELTGDAVIIWSADHGDSWSAAASIPQSGHFVTDLVHANGLFVAGTDVFDWRSDARVLVSTDGNIWQDVVLRDEVAASYALLHDGSRFIAAGSPSTVFVSADGYYWTELPTPTLDVDYLGIAWSGTSLVMHGGITWWHWWGNAPPPYRPVGISSTDGGATWDIFDIDGYYQSRGMAWGDGRFVSVGQSTPVSREGAIYTTP